MNLLPYQQKDVDKICGPWRDRSVYLGHVMGLGKTIIAIAAWKKLEAHNVLVVCPASVRGVWKGEVDDWDASAHVQTILTQNVKILLKRHERNVVVVSYDLAVSKFIARQLIHDYTWNLVIFDECHCLGSIDSKRTELCCGSLYKRAKKCLFLSGSIQRDKIHNVWPVFKTLCPKKIPSYWNFIERYVYYQDTKYGPKFLGGINLEELGKIAKKNFLIRRTKKEITLPPKLEQKLLITLPEVEQTRFEQAKLDFSDAVEKSFFTGRITMDENLATSRRELGENKVRAAVETILDLLGLSDSSDGTCEKLVVFCYHKSVYHALGAALHNHQIAWVGIDGSVPGRDRESAIKAFQTKPDIQVFLGTFAAAEGITLTAASTVLFVEMSWSLSQNEQAQDRLHRIGQKDTVYVKYLLVENTLDKTVYNVYKRKSTDKRRLLDEQAETSTVSKHDGTGSGKFEASNDNRSRQAGQKANGRAYPKTGTSFSSSSQRKGESHHRA